ncbi:hypothetical protein HYDPIDRAFT_113249 [Hydnomerulius pinastri MD-312]|uniref:F-box domain-containing protein n=1 Tax=Hydnomerulius pinastri MD-312 TaxID=994086 RepID=A0A0C9WDR1_9AGAM|nr:hypothetical protein HYDPIDRAFT_113249 [Hydnomerulius pinastri MD-312]
MHDCLQVPEVVNLIASKISEGRFGSKNLKESGRVLQARVAVLNFARSCRAFKEPALDVLWSKLTSLEPLIRCLPRDLWRRSSPGGPLVIERALFAQDWEIFHYYARRVRSLQFTKFQSSRIDNSFVLAVSGSPTLPLLPNLKEMLWFDGSEMLSQLLCFLLGPSLQILSLHEDQPTQLARQAVIASLGQFCPSLRRLTMKSTELSANNCRAICGLKHLTYLTVGSINNRLALEYTSSLQSLVELEVLVAETTLPNRPFQSVITFTQNLRSLRINALTFSSACSLFSDTSFSLEELTIEVQKLGSTSLDVCLFTALRSFTATLTKCQIRMMTTIGTTDPNDTCFSFSLAGLASLLSCRKLQELKFYGLCRSVINDSDMERMAKSWPELTVLHFGVDHAWRDPPKLTLSGLCSLLEHCPLLSRLEVAFIAQVSEPFTSIPPKKHMVNERITYLYVGTSPIEEPLKVAAFLSAILPNLKLFELSVDGGVDPVHLVHRERWKLAQESYQLFVMARQQGMNIQAVREENSMDASKESWSEVLVK